VRSGDRRPPELTGPAGPRGRLLAGTSGFAYPGWSPRFYPPDVKPASFLAFYAQRFAACELNNTFYQRPTDAKIGAWVAATPSSFRFSVKAQRGGSMRALLQDPHGSVPWLTDGLRAFGERLGTVLFRVPSPIRVDVDNLRRLLDLWPRQIPLTLEFQDESWQADEVYDALRAAEATLCATDLMESPETPTLRLTGRHLYLRLRRDDYSVAEIEAWAGRLAPFIDSGTDAYVFFRHDETGRATELAGELHDALQRVAA
jgi:uncharacterized protein YecE (DUF72 family)